jgi:hypothetical protein
VPLESPVSQSFGCIPKSGITGSNGRLMSSFLSSLQIFFQSGCTSLHSHQQCKRVPFSPHPRQHLLLAVFATEIKLDHFVVNRNDSSDNKDQV